MGYRKTYKANGARMFTAVDGGAPAAPQIPHGTLRKVDCPDCPAIVDERCRSNTSGKDLNQVHISRRRIAMRKYNQEREQANADET